MKLNHTNIGSARALIERAHTIVVLTGAGVSAESGVPTFRSSPASLWSEFSPEDLATPEAWRKDPDLVWGWYLWRMISVLAASPNAGHIALADTAKRRKLRVVTQNVDDLHERAGSTDVVHLHGQLFAHRCCECSQPFPNVAIPSVSLPTPLRVAPPRCGLCGARIRPGVVWFGEPLPAFAHHEAVRATLAADAMLVVGTSGLVFPAAGLPELAKDHRIPIVEINPCQTALSKLATFCLRTTATVGLSTLLNT